MLDELADYQRSETTWARPACIVQPVKTSDVQEAVRILVAQSIPFAIRAGGHSPSPAAGNINRGVLFDVSSLNGAVRYDAANNVASVGPGLTWGHVYRQLDAYKVTAVGGRMVDVGVGGFLLGCKFGS